MIKIRDLSIKRKIQDRKKKLHQPQLIEEDHTKIIFYYLPYLWSTQKRKEQEVKQNDKQFSCYTAQKRD